MTPRKLLPILASALCAAAAVSAVGIADGRAPSAAPVSVTTNDGTDAASLVAGTTATEPYSRTGLDDSLPEILRTNDRVDPSRAWRVEIPGDDRPGWIFAGDENIALVLPRTTKAPGQNEDRNGASIFGATALVTTTTGFAASQSGGGQPFRIVAVLPPGVPDPFVVEGGRSAPVGKVLRSGRIFVSSPLAGQELLVPSFADRIRRLGGRDR